MNKQAKLEMTTRIASLKLAKIEKEAFLNIKKIMTKIMSFLPRGMQAMLQGADEDQIATQVKRLQKDKKFMKIVEEAPKKSSIKELWGYFSFSIKRAYRFGKSALAVATILAIIFSLLGGVAYYLGGGEIASVLAGFLIAPAFDVDFEVGPNKKQQESNAREIAKSRLLNNRRYR